MTEHNDGYDRVPNAVEVSVWIVSSFQHSAPDDLDLPHALIVPSSNNWNDFGYRHYAEMRVRNEEGDARSFHLKIAFEGANGTDTYLNAVLEERSSPVSLVSIESPYLSLLHEESAYRELVEHLGFEESVGLLRSLRDLSLMRVEGMDDAATRMFESEAAYTGLLRSSDAYGALERGARHIRPKPTTAVGDAASTFSAAVRLPNIDNTYDLEFLFGDDLELPSRSAVLIGENGTGKTQLLSSLVRSVAEPSDDGVVEGLNATRIIVFSSVPTDPFPRTIGAWRGLDYVYYATNARDEGSDGVMHAALAFCRRDAGTPFLLNGNERSRWSLLKRALNSIGMWEELHVPLREIGDGEEEFGETIRTKNGLYAPVRLKMGEKRDLDLTRRVDPSRPVIVTDDDEDARALSSGEYAMLRFAVQAVASIEQGSLLLLDEPESHLHPRYITQLMVLLDELLEATRSIAIIATHSSYVVREVPRSQVFVLRVDEREGRTERPRLQTLGASVDAISQFVFGDLSIDPRYHKRLLDWAKAVQPDEDIEALVDAHAESLNAETISFLARKLQPDDSVE